MTVKPGYMNELSVIADALDNAYRERTSHEDIEGNVHIKISDEAAREISRIVRKIKESLDNMENVEILGSNDMRIHAGIINGKDIKGV